MNTPHNHIVSARPWEVSFREWDDHHSICTPDGYCVAVRPKLLTRAEWQPIAQEICNKHNRQLGCIDATWVLRQIINDISGLENKDWFNPELERAANDCIKVWEKNVKSRIDSGEVP